MVIDFLKDVNLSRGFSDDLVLPYRADDIEIDNDKVSDIVNDLSMAAEYTP